MNPYLNFDGKTEEAFNFYKSVFGGEFTGVHRMGMLLICSFQTTIKSALCISVCPLARILY